MVILTLLNPVQTGLVLYANSKNKIVGIQFVFDVLACYNSENKIRQKSALSLMYVCSICYKILRTKFAGPALSRAYQHGELTLILIPWRVAATFSIQDTF